MTPRIVSSNTYMRCFQYKVLNNVLFLNKKLFLFKKSNSPLCSFCKEEDETVFHLYFCCPNVRNLWNQLKSYLAEDLTLPRQTLQTAVLAFPRKTIPKMQYFITTFFWFLNFTFIVLGKKDFWMLWVWWIRYWK